jgi:hypothetical protein
MDVYLFEHQERIEHQIDDTLDRIEINNQDLELRMNRYQEKELPQK